MLPDSARARRRLILAGCLAALLAAGATVALLIPGTKPAPSAPIANEGPAQLAVVTPTGKLTPADRKAIDATLDRFLPAGMERKDLPAAWALAGPEMRSNTSVAEWRNGTSPIPYFPLRDTRFHSWQTIDVGSRYVVFNLLLHPKAHSGRSPTVFSGQVVKEHGRWLVNRLYTMAIMKTHEVGPADFAAPGTSAQPPAGKPLLKRAALLPIVALLALVLLIPLSFGVLAFVRTLRWRRQVRANGRNELPPLPDAYRRRKQVFSER
jgi:hypothetical protein